MQRQSRETKNQRKRREHDLRTALEAERLLAPRPNLSGRPKHWTGVDLAGEGMPYLRNFLPHATVYPAPQRRFMSNVIAIDMETAPLKLLPATERAAMAPVVLKGVSIDYSAIDEALRFEELLSNTDYSTIEMRTVTKLLSLGKPSGLSPGRLADFMYKQRSRYTVHEAHTALANFRETYPELAGYFSSRSSGPCLTGRSSCSAPALQRLTYRAP